MSRVTIRAALGDSADLAAVTAIMGHYVEHTVATFLEEPPAIAYWSQRQEKLTAQGLPFLVAEVDHEVVGFAYAAPWRPKPGYRYTVENTVYLAPALTGQGLGSALLRELIAETAAAGCRQMIAVIADTGDPASLGLHWKLGFGEVGRLSAVGFKHGRWVDTVLMQRALAHDPSSDLETSDGRED